ncbi:hypothetical protein D3C78_1242540 [compost metagenome]
MYFHLQRRRHDLAAQRSCRQGFQLGVFGKAGGRSHQDIVVILDALPLIATKGGHKLAEIFGIGIDQNFWLGIARGGVPTWYEVGFKQLPIFGNNRDLNRLTGREAGKFIGRFQFVQVTGQMSYFELIVIHPHGLTGAVEVNRPVVTFDLLMIVGQADQHLVAGRPVGTQLTAIQAAVGGPVIDHFQIQF